MKPIMPILAATLALSGCANGAARLEAPRSALEFKLDDLERLSVSDPASAIQLEGALAARYGEDAVGPDRTYRERALDALEAELSGAIESGRWLDALSLERSLAAAGRRARGPSEAELVLKEARRLLSEGSETAAFLMASRSASLSPLGEEDSRLFLTAAVASRQHGSAAYFARALRAAGGTVDPESAAFADAAVTPAELVSGVATVWVDRGIKIENGFGYPDRVIGSAFFVDRSGYLVTNYHVISSEVDPTWDGWSRLYIRLGDENSPRIPAKVVGWDSLLDLALLKTEVEPDFVFSVLDASPLEIGEKVYAIGSPAGLEKTISSGIVSALGRRFLQLGSVVQIDAAVNAGNSGGPVVDERGRLAGVAFAGIEQFEGVNFAIPASYLDSILPALFRGGELKRPWLGVALSEDRHGVTLTYAAPGSPASDQLVPEGDRIASLDGVPAASVSVLQDVLTDRRPGELFSLEMADGRRYLLRGATRPEHPLTEAAKRDTKERLLGPLFGLYLTATGQGLFNPEYLVRRVSMGGVADESGLAENDPLSIRSFAIEEKDGYALLDIFVKKRRDGYMESLLRLAAPLDSSNLL